MFFVFLLGSSAIHKRPRDTATPDDDEGIVDIALPAIVPPALGPIEGFDDVFRAVAITDERIEPGSKRKFLKIK